MLRAAPVRMPARLVRRAAILAALAVALTASIVGSAAAATYTYCNGCTIPSGYERVSAASRHAYISYVHRLSGPSSSLSFASAYYYYNPNTIICREQSYGTEVACNPGYANVYGGAANLGGGNYGYNAHLGY